MTKKKIILHGHLVEKYPREIVVEAASVAEALHSLSTIDELTPPNGEPWPIIVREVDNEIALYSDTSLEEIHVYPRMGGAKKGGLLQIILGVVMIALAVSTGGITALGITEGSMILAGGMMVVGGLLQMLIPTPKGRDGDGDTSSKYLGASGNTVKIGTHITIAYGTNKIGGHYLSFDVDAVDWAGEDDETGDAALVGENIYVEHDKTPVITVPVNPIFSSPTLGPGNVPTSGWIN